MVKTDTSRRKLLSSPAGVIALVSALGVAAYSGWVFSAAYDPHNAQIIAGVGSILLGLLCCTLGAVVVFKPEYGPALRLTWLMFTLGTLSLTIGEVINLYSQAYQTASLLPGRSDPLYLLFYPLFLIGLLIFPRVFVPRQERGLLNLDLAVLILFFAMLIWEYLLGASTIANDITQGNYLLIAYPAGDVLLLAALIALMQRDLTRVARWILGFMALGTVFNGLANGLFAYLELNQPGSAHLYLNILWMAAAQMHLLAHARLLASGPGMLDDPPARFSPLRHLFRLALPYLAISAGLALLAWVILAGPSWTTRLVGLLVGAYAIVVLVLLRQYLVLKENVRLYQTMRRIAWTDSLTGVYNRHFFNEMLPREMERAGRYRHQLSVLLMDVDGFKLYNDTYGHLQGDQVLKTVARLVFQQLRSSDTVARFGGDEFVAILPEANRRKAYAIAQRIRESVSSHTFGDNGLQVSIGVTSFRPGLTPEQLLEEADQDMYRRKHAARNHQDENSASL